MTYSEAKNRDARDDDRTRRTRAIEDLDGFPESQGYDPWDQAEEMLYLNRHHFNPKPKYKREDR